MTQVLTDRATIRHYIADMLRDEIDVGGRVFMNRPSAIKSEEMPLVIVMMDESKNDVWSGDPEHVKSYKVQLQVNITVAVEQIADSETTPDMNDAGPDFLDWLSYQVERAFKRDPMLALRLDGYDPNSNYLGIIHGHRIEGTSTYEVETESEKTILAHQIRIVITYDEDGYVDTRFDNFEQYYAAIIRPGSTEETVDRELIEMQGDVQ